MNSFVIVSLLCQVEVCTGTIAGGWSALGRPGLSFKSDFPILTGQGMFSLSWEGTALSLLRTAPPCCFFLPGSCWVQMWLPRRIQESQRAWACQAFLYLPHTLQTPRKWVRINGKERASQVSNHISLKAEATGRDPWQFCLFGKIGRWPDLTLNYLTANHFLPSSINGRMTPLSPGAEDRWIHQRMLISLQVWLWGLSLFFQERVKSQISLFLPVKGGSFVQSPHKSFNIVFWLGYGRVYVCPQGVATAVFPFYTYKFHFFFAVIGFICFQATF